MFQVWITSLYHNTVKCLFIERLLLNHLINLILKGIQYLIIKKKENNYIFESFPSRNLKVSKHYKTELTKQILNGIVKMVKDNQLS